MNLVHNKGENIIKISQQSLVDKILEEKYSVPGKGRKKYRIPIPSNTYEMYRKYVLVDSDSH